MNQNRLLLLSVLFFLLQFQVLRAQQAFVMTGCLSQDANGALRFEVEPSKRVYFLRGDMTGLQRHINQQLAISARSAGDSGSPALSVVGFSVQSETCTSALPSNESFVVPGKVGQVQVATPVASVGNANETTPGFQTEAGQQQAERTYVPTAGSEQHTRIPFGPSYPEQSGQSELAADIDAQAASRAEMYPGSTLGVNSKTAPPSSIQAAQEAGTKAAKPPSSK